MKKPLPLRIRVFITTAISSFIPLVLALTILYFSFTQILESQIASEAMDIASLASNRQDVKQAYGLSSPSEKLQPIAERIMEYTQAAFVVFMDKEGKRYSHPNESLIGLPFTGGDEGRALKGESYSSKAVGISGPSIRAFKPIYGSSGELMGAVAVGFYKPDITLVLSKIYRTMYLVVPLGAAIIILLSVFLANNIKKLMFGMEPLEIAMVLKERDGMLHSVKEGIIAIDNNSRITIINQAAQNFFPPGTEFLGRNISELIPDSQLPQVMENQQPQEDEQLLLNGSVVITNRLPLVVGDKVMGAIATFRPLTEVNRVAEELTGVQKIVNALRARTHEFSNKLHVISGLIQLEAYEEAHSYIANLTNREQSLISFLINNVQDSAIAGLLMGKASEAEERQISLEIDRETKLIRLPHYFDEHAMVVVLGNLIENAFDAVQDLSARRQVTVLIKQSPKEILLEVGDNGPGIPYEARYRLFDPGFTTKDKGLGFGMTNVKNRVSVAGGAITFRTSDSGTTFRVLIPYKLF